MMSRGRIIMKNYLYLMIVAVLLVGGMESFLGEAVAAEESKVEWLTDFNAAKKSAAKEKRPILIDFSGSDWCVWCIRLDKEVFSKPEFKKYADENLVLFLADFPSRKKQSDKVKKQNKKLSEKYGVKGFPTLILIDSKGKLIARTGYRKGGSEKYVEHLKELLKK
jgi:protein disulfide-isomerase